MSTDGFESEAALVQTFLATLNHRHGQGKDWTVYPETAGWDLLLVHKDGYQLGLEAKLSLNAKVIDQALQGASSYWDAAGPDYRGVIVPKGKLQAHMGRICKAVGLGIIALRPEAAGALQWIALPSQSSMHDESWPNWCPGEREKLPAYIPDVQAGVKSPVQLTDWKIRAIRLMIILERRGYVTRRDMKAIGISPTRWCDRFGGLLNAGEHGYVRNHRTPDLRAQHPINFAQIEAEAPQWIAAMNIDLSTEQQGVLL